MKFDIKRQEEYSRGDLILRALFGPIYIMIPHAIAMGVMGILSAIYGIVSFFTILINGRISENIYNFQVGMLRWSARVQARNYNLRDGYPAFGVDGQDDGLDIQLEQPAERDKVSVILRFFFGAFYVALPHAFCLAFLLLGVLFVNTIQFWIILITGKANEGIFNYIVGVLRWSARLSAYMNYLTDTYPPFSTQP
jgi:hypothetical protein